MTGAALGFLCYLIFAAVQTAGDLIDVSGGFSLGFVYDPMLQSGNAVIGRFYQMTALTLLFASGGYLIVLQGFLASYRLIPLNGALAIGSISEAVTGATSGMLLAAPQIAGPDHRGALPGRHRAGPADREPRRRSTPSRSASRSRS